MIRTDKLRGIISERGMSQSKGVFGSYEIEIMIKELRIENPMEIFFDLK